MATKTPGDLRSRSSPLGSLSTMFRNHPAPEGGRSLRDPQAESLYIIWVDVPHGRSAHSIGAAFSRTDLEQLNRRRP
ncbi:MAG: hypothetical protein MZU91_11795 [Desulfosudis oleivorans]|nr:hypothetical protein [Desulfosudis oleivorans]